MILTMLLLPLVMTQLWLLEEACQKLQITSGVVLYTPLVSYTLSRGIHTVSELWNEWYEGLNRGPSVVSMNRLYKAKWRDSDKERRFYTRRLQIITGICYL